MKEYRLDCIDCTWVKCKNVHLLESIEMYFYVGTNGIFVIEYSFHEKDFYLWEQVLKIHKENVEKCVLYDNFDEEVLELENDYKYYILKIKSEDANLYRNISMIMYIENNVGWNNSEEMLIKNTWNF